MLGLATALLLLLPEVVLPRPTDLTAAAADTVELERLATRLGPARLLHLLEGNAGKRQPKVALAALRGLGLMGAVHPDLGMLALVPFTETLGRLGQARQLDDKQMTVASEALYRICGALGRDSTCTEDAPATASDCGFNLYEATEHLFGLGSEPHLPLPLREGALEGLSALPPAAWQHLWPRLIALAQAPLQKPPMDREVPAGHEALVVLATLLPRGQPEPLLSVIRTAPPEVASDAVSQLCAAQPASRRGVHPATPLPDDVATRVRTLAAADQPPRQRQGLLECLRLLGTPGDRALIQNILSAGRKKGK
jgi:hypothetical protein